MTGREKILARVKSNQSGLVPSELIQLAPTPLPDVIAKFKETLVSIGGAVIELHCEAQFTDRLKVVFPAVTNQNIIGPENILNASPSPHAFQNVDIAILRADFAVAENGAVWITDRAMIDRALPFICSNLVLIVSRESVIATMHDAYDRIGQSRYEFGTFIAGPSKTADIEQSLVLGAHGAKTLTCFLLG